MNLEKSLTKLFFGTPVKGERVKADYEIMYSTTYPHGGARQSEEDWKKEFNVGARYSRFDAQGNFYNQAGDEQSGNVLKMILTGSY